MVPIFICLLFSAPLPAQEGDNRVPWEVLPAQEEDSLALREAILIQDAEAYSDRAAREGLISAARRDSIRRFLRDSLPDVPGVLNFQGIGELRRSRIDRLEKIIEGIDADYDRAIREYEDMLAEMGRPGILPDKLDVPDDAPDAKRGHTMEEWKEQIARIYARTHARLSVAMPHVLAGTRDHFTMDGCFLSNFNPTALNIPTPGFAAGTYVDNGMDKRGRYGYGGAAVEQNPYRVGILRDAARKERASRKAARRNPRRGK